MTLKLCNSRYTKAKSTLHAIKLFYGGLTFSSIFQEYILVGHYSHSTSVDAKIMELKKLLNH